MTVAATDLSSSDPRVRKKQLAFDQDAGNDESEILTLDHGDHVVVFQSDRTGGDPFTAMEFYVPDAAGDLVSLTAETGSIKIPTVAASPAAGAISANMKPGQLVIKATGGSGTRTLTVEVHEVG